MDLADREPNKVVMNIRQSVAEWRTAKYEGATPMSRRLLWHWTDPQSMKLRPFFAQVEAVETLIWLREIATRANPSRRELEKQARQYNDEIVRFCSKMATGTGKTAVMGMVIAWQTLNSARSRRTRNVMHADRFAVFSPGHTVRERLRVLLPSAEGNVYDEMGVVPHDLRPLLNRARIRIVNYQAFTQRELIENSRARKLLGKAKRGDIESWKAAVCRVLGDIVDATGRVCVLNDEAHHCYLPKSRVKGMGEERSATERAAVWFNTIRAMRDMGVLGKVTEHGQECPVYDFTATPLWIDTASKSEPEQFQWVSSDFGLMDAIESGLVKVPRVPIDDDSSRDETVWRKLYANTHPKNLTSLRDGEGNVRLPEALNAAVNAVVNDWNRKLHVWQPPPPPPHNPNRQLLQPTPPVIIFVVNSIANAKVLWEYLSGKINEDGTWVPGAFQELSNIDGCGNWYANPRTLLVHSKVDQGDTVPDVLKKALADAAEMTKSDAEAAVRRMLNTVGKAGEPGAQVRCVVSVSMLTEGWDARTVTHIVGFRAFSTQLLCEQVTGRALRRTSYDALREPDGEGRRLLEAEYADVVGIPFEFMPDLNQPEQVPRPPKPRTRVHTVRGRRDLRVSWPQVVEYMRVASQGRFSLNPKKVKSLQSPETTAATMAALGGVAGPDEVITSEIELARARTTELKLAAEVTSQVTATDGTRAGFGRESLFRCAHRAVLEWVAHRLNDEIDLKVILTDTGLRNRAVTAILEACDFFEESPGLGRRARLANPKILNTSGIDFETTLEHIYEPQRSELSHAACHSQLEIKTARVLDGHPEVLRWVRNFQLGWTIPYWRDGAWARYEPDFVAVLDNGVNMAIECKGVWDAKAHQAAEYTREHWVPSLAGSTDLPDDLRAWSYAVIDEPTSIEHQLSLAVNETTERKR